MAKFPCPCCKFLTLPELGGFALCPVCFWEDDGQTEANADEVRGGPNFDLSLRQAQANFKRFGAMAEHLISKVRPPNSDEIP